MMRAAIAGAILCLLVVFTAPSSVLADAPVVTDSTLQAPAHLTVGDHLSYVIKVEADRGSTVALASGALPPVLTLTQAPQTQTRPLSGGRVEITLTLELAAFVPGSISLPPLGLTYRGPDGSTSTLQTGATAVNVESVLPESAGDLAPRDLKPQEEIAGLPPGALVPAVASAAVLVIVVGAFWLWQSRRLRRRFTIALPVLDPALVSAEDRARFLLDGAGSAFDDEADYIAYYATIAETVRGYLTERFEFPAFALTTRELQAQMVRRGVDRWQARLVGGLLSQCDAVVYAHYRPAGERADADLTAAYEIVEMSRPEPEPGATPEVAPEREAALP